MTFDIDTIETAGQSVTATICENDAIDAVSEAFRILAEGVAPDGFQLADERESLLWASSTCSTLLFTSMRRNALELSGVR